MAAHGRGEIDLGQGEIAAAVGGSYVVAQGAHLQVFDGISGQKRYDVPACMGDIQALVASESRRVCFYYNTGPDMVDVYVLDVCSGEVSFLDRFNPYRFLRSIQIS